MNDTSKYLNAFALIRPDSGYQLSVNLHMGTDKPVRILTSIPAYNHDKVVSFIQSNKPEVVLVDAHAPGFSTSDILSIKAESKAPFVLIGVAQAGSAEMEEFMGTQSFDILIPLPLSEASLTKICDEAPEIYEKLKSEWGTGVWSSNTAENIRTAMSQSTGQSWARQAIVSWSPKGGVGKTTLAVETAAALASIAGRNVALVDANMNGGHVRIKLNLSDKQNILSAASNFSMMTGNADTGIANLGREFGIRLNNIIQPVAGTSNLKVITGISDMAQARVSDIAGDNGMRFISFLIKYLKQSYDFVLIDLGSSINVGVHFGAFSEADSIMVIATPDLTGLADIKKSVDNLEKTHGLDRSRFSLVMNMWQDDLGVSLKDAAELVGLTSAASIPLDPTGSPTLCSNKGISYIANFAGKKDNPKVIESTLYGFITLASQYYPPIGAAWAERLRKEEPKKLGTGLKLFNRGK